MNFMKKNGKDRSNWVIIDGIPPLRRPQDYTTYANAFKTCAKECDEKCKVEPLLYIPIETINESKHSKTTQIKGCAIIAFFSKDGAHTFVNKWHMHKALQMFKGHIGVYSYQQYLDLMSLPEDYKQFKLKREEYFEQRNLIWWLFDEPGKERYRDQFVLRFHRETEIYWMDELVKSKRMIVYAGEREKAMNKTMSAGRVEWSSLGHYLATFHSQGIKLVGGPQWLELQRLEHSHVSHTSFSPDDKFLVTCSAKPRAGGKNRGRNERGFEEKLRIWDTLTGKVTREFDFEDIGPTIKQQQPGWWPIMQWSHDSKFFAKIGSKKKMAAKPKDYDKINIYDSSTMTQLDNRAVNAPNLFHIKFSPTDDLLAYSTFQSENDASSVSIIRLPDKNDARPSQVLGFDIQTAHLYWQSEGKFLAIKMGHSVSKKNLRVSHHSIGIVAVKKSNMPYTKCSDNLDKIETFSWEPNGSRFAIIHGKKNRFDCTFYDVKDDGNLKRLFSLPNRRSNTIKWAPSGGRCLLAFVEPGRTGVLEFVDVDNVHNPNKVETVTQEHQNCRFVDWDPSGRYLVSAATQAIQSTSAGDDTGYKIWTYQGEELHNKNIKYFYQFLWRPRPKTLLTPHEMRRVQFHEQKNYAPIFDECDRAVQREHTDKKIKANLRKLDDWNRRITYNRDLNDFRDEIEEKQRQLRSHYKVDYKNEYDVSTTEEEINVTVQQNVISKDVLNKIMNQEYIDFNSLDENGNIVFHNNNNSSNNTSNRPHFNMNMNQPGAMGNPMMMRPGNPNMQRQPYYGR